MKKVKFVKKAGFYNGIYPEGSVVMVDDNFAAYTLGLGDTVLAEEKDPITDPTPYVMKPRTTDAEESLAIIANALKPKAASAEKT